MTKKTIKILVNPIFILYKVFSVVLPCSCRFYPTCSDYSKNAITKYGFTKGLVLTFKRLLKCNPAFPGGYDPVK